MTDFWQEKSKQNTKKLWGFRIQKDSINVLHEIFLKKNPFKRFQNFFQTKKTFFKRSKEKFSKGVSKIFQELLQRKMPFSQKFIRKSPSRITKKFSPKIIPKVLQKSSKVLLFSQHKSPFYRRRFRKYFQIKNLFSKKTQE